MTLLSARNGKAQAFLALSCVGSALSPAMAQTAPAPTEKQAPALGGVTVTDTAIDEAPGGQQESPKATRPVRDTPQTITVLSAATIEEQNLLTFREILQTVPGITFAAGEAGGGFGDGPTLRGYTATSDITVDGVRDSGQYSRTDPFNTEQVEVTNGANSVTAGSGSVGGSINIVTKRPKADTAVVLSAGIGTDNYYRGTVDANLRVGEMAAFRLNAVGHRNDIAGRDVENFKRWGIAPSVTIGIDGPTRLTLGYVHQEDDNIPEYGAPYVNTLGGLLPGATYSAYYGFKNVDKQKIRSDQFSIIAEHDFSDMVKIRNLTRYQDVRQTTWVDGPEGIWCLAATGLQANGTACTVDLDTRTGATQVFNITVPAGYYLPQGGPRGAARDSRNQLGFTQTDLSAVVNTGGIEHTIVFGGAITWESYALYSGNFQRAADGTNPLAFNPSAPSGNAHMPYLNIANPNAIVTGPTVVGGVYGNNVYTGPVNVINTSAQNGELKNYAVYLFDTMKLSQQFEFSFGLRYEKNKGWYRPDTIAGQTATSPGTTTVGTKVWNEDDLFSYRVGLNYKPIEAISIYAAYGNSKTPSKSAVNGACTIAGVNGATVSSCSVNPETAVNYEVGIKAELGEGVLLTAALFRNERSNYKVNSVDPTVPDQQLDGKSRVNGIALGANGRITPSWTVTANYTYLDSKVLRSVATGAAIDPVAGNPLTNTPKHSGSFFTNYTLPFGLVLGYGLNYQGKFYMNNSGAVLYQVKDYLIQNASLSYKISEALSAQVNVKNLTDKKYFTGVRNGATINTQWARVGEGRSAVLTVNYRF
jgi:catecholate siderophore receptor